MRKVILFLMLSSLVLISIFTISLAQTQAAVSSTYRGDINEDGNVNIFDLLGMLGMLSNPEGTTERERQIADMDGGGSVNIFDLLDMLQVLSGAGEPGVIYWGPAIVSLSWTIAAEGDTLVAYLDNIDEAATIGDVSLQIDEQDVEILSFTQDSVGIIIPQWFVGGQLRLVVADDTTNSVLTLLYIPGIVNSTSDSGTGSLRHAITNASPGDSISFDPTVFPPAGPDTIVLVSQLPELDQGSLVIDASDAGVVLDGSMISESDAFGISIFSRNNVIRGLHIKDFSSAGIALHGGTKNNTIGGNRNIGEGPSGQGNVITCTVYSGNVGIWCYGTSSNTIQGNFIGTDISGTTSQGRFNPSISIEGEGADYNLVEDNLIGGYQVSGVSIGGVSAGHNTVRGNYIGTDTSGVIKISRSRWYGVSIDNSGLNIIGPANVIAFNKLSGIYIIGEEAVGNRITQNSIYDNGGLGIDLLDGGNTELAAPLLLDFDLQAGTVTGWACPNCIVEIFSDGSDEGAIYEGQVVADDSAAFAFSKGASFTDAHLTMTATDPDGNTSEFSSPTIGSSGSYGLQDGNSLAMIKLQSKTSSQLVSDDRLGWGIGIERGALPHWSTHTQEVFDICAKRFETFLGQVESPIDWSFPEDEIPVEFDRIIDAMNENGVAVNYEIHWFDKIGHAAGEELPNPRFTTEEEVQEFLDYVRFLVGHFKGRVQYYTLFTEQESCGPGAVKCIEPLDYIELARQTIPVIREVDPQAKVVTGTIILYGGRDHLFTLLRSDVIQLFDVISTHPIFDMAPGQEYFRFVTRNGVDEPLETFEEYYYNYPALIDSILQTASAHGFQGQYWGTDLTWFIEGTGSPYEWSAFTERQSTKYHARGIVMHLGKDAGVDPIVIKGHPVQFYMVARLYTILAGTEPIDLGVEIESEATNIESYGFTHPNGDKSLALWTNGEAVDDDPGVTTTLTFPGVSASRVTGIDAVDRGGFEQELIAETENGNLVIRGFLVKDYPIFISIE
jgi:dockerin type I repeat protein